MKKSKGFTLIEILIVVLIIGILAAISWPHYEKALLKADYVKTSAFVDSLWRTVEEYYAINGRYPNDFTYLGVDMPPGCSMDKPTSIVCDELTKRKWRSININSWEMGAGQPQRITTSRTVGRVQGGLQYQRFFYNQKNKKYTFFNGGYPGMAICSCSTTDRRSMIGCEAVGKPISAGSTLFII